MSDTSTDDVRKPRSGDDPDRRAQEEVLRDEVEDDGPVEPPVIACTRCEARVVMGSRYCPSCGVPLVRSGEEAAAALSRTRRHAPRSVRLLMPLLLLFVVGAVWYVANTDPLEAERDDLQERVERVVAEHRTLSDRLEELKADTDFGAALGAARSALSTLRDVEEETQGVESGTTGRTTRVRRALATDRLYLSAVVGVLQNPRSSLVDQLGGRSARAVAALDSIDDIAVTKDAIRGTRILADAARARVKNPSREGPDAAEAAPAKPRPPFVRAVEGVIRSGTATRADVARGFALLRAARDGVSTWDGDGPAPASADVAVQEAERLFTEAARDREASAAEAREVATKQENQRDIVAKLAAAYVAGGATAKQLAGCIGSFRNSGAATVARQCLEAVRPRSEAETLATRAFVASYRPARTDAGLGPTPTL